MTEPSVAVVTGGSRGTRRAVCRALASAGHAVVAVGRDASAPDGTAHLVEADGGRCSAAVAPSSCRASGTPGRAAEGHRGAPQVAEVPDFDRAPVREALQQAMGG